MQRSLEGVPPAACGGRDGRDEGGYREVLRGGAGAEGAARAMIPLFPRCVLHRPLRGGVFSIQWCLLHAMIMGESSFWRRTAKWRLLAAGIHVSAFSLPCSRAVPVTSQAPPPSATSVQAPGTLRGVPAAFPERVWLSSSESSLSADSSSRTTAALTMTDWQIQHARRSRPLPCELGGSRPVGVPDAATC